MSIDFSEQADIFYFCQKGDLKKVMELSGEINEVGIFGRTPLMVAILCKQKQIVDYFLSIIDKIDTNKRDNKHKKALHYAILIGDFTITKALILNYDGNIYNIKDSLFLCANKSQNKDMKGFIAKHLKRSKERYKETGAVNV